MSKTPIDLNPWRAALLCYGLALLLLAVDQISKAWIYQQLPFGNPQPIFEPWLYFTHVHNDGAAFSIMRGKKWLLSLIALAVAIWVVQYERRLKIRHPLHLMGLACILAGALGNMVDRFRLGFVVDFLDLHYAGRNIWPIFNVADICINLGVGLLIFYFWRYPEPASQEPNKEEEGILKDASIG